MGNGVLLLVLLLILAGAVYEDQYFRRSSIGARAGLRPSVLFWLVLRLRVYCGTAGRLTLDHLRNETLVWCTRGRYPLR